MYDFPIALQLYSVRDDMEADFEGTLKKVKALGYDGVEFAGLLLSLILPRNTVRVRISSPK